MSFQERYSLPANVRDGVEIKLEDVTFTVALPTQANRKYQRKLANKMAAKAINTDGTLDMSNITVSDMIDAQIVTFLDTCVLSVVGLDYNPVIFLDEYPEAAEELYAEAIDQANAADEAAEIEAGKSQDTSAGKSSGEMGEMTSTQNLSDAVESARKNADQTSGEASGF